jgi:hypothetical protein
MLRNSAMVTDLVGVLTGRQSGQEAHNDARLYWYSLLIPWNLPANLTRGVRIYSFLRVRVRCVLATPVDSGVEAGSVHSGWDHRRQGTVQRPQFASRRHGVPLVQRSLYTLVLHGEGRRRHHHCGQNVLVHVQVQQLSHSGDAQNPGGVGHQHVCAEAPLVSVDDRGAGQRRQRVPEDGVKLPTPQRLHAIDGVVGQDQALMGVPVIYAESEIQRLTTEER